MRAGPRDDLAGGIDYEQFNGIARRAGPHHLGRSVVNGVERCNGRGVLADQLSLSVSIWSPGLHYAEGGCT